MVSLKEKVDIDLDSLFEEHLRCSSRAVHTCTEVALYRVRSTFPCSDPVGSVFWCSGRHRAHQFINADTTCRFCARPVNTCWHIIPI